MTDFDKINEMINLIEDNKISEGLSFNDFAVEFFEAVKYIPLSKYLRKIGKEKKVPKVMNMRKAGEILLDTYKDEEVLSFVKRKSKDNKIPELNYRSIMLLRKISLRDNWTKILRFQEGKESIDEINLTTRPSLLPQEKEVLESFIKEELNIKDEELDFLLVKTKKILANKELLKTIKKLIR